MSLRAFLKQCLMQYFIITTLVTAATGILGLSLDPGARFGYESFFSPLLFGFLSLAPSVVTFSRKELSLRQTLLRKALYVLLLEGTLIAFGVWSRILQSPSEAALFALAVLIVFALVNLINWLIGRREAGQINRILKSMQGGN